MDLKSINPANQAVVGAVKIASQAEIEKAVQKARKAFAQWRFTAVLERAEYVQRFAREFLKHKKRLAKLCTQEMGKPIKEAQDEVDWIKKYLDFYIQRGPQILQDEIIEKKKDVLRRVTREPIGVCAVITPWNFPIGLTVWGIIPNLIAGNTIVFKPSEITPLVGQVMVEILAKTGLPQGVVNIIHGDGLVGNQLVESDVDFVWFTGSSKVGQEIYQKCGRKFIRCLLELGGSTPAIVLDDAVLDNAVKNIYTGRFENNGQVCSAIKRLFVHQKIYKEVLACLLARLKKTRVGNPMTDVNFGPLASQNQLKLLETQVQDAIAKGAQVEIGGQRPQDPTLRKGSYFLPTILTKIKMNMRVVTQEVFGPVLPIIPFQKIKEAIKLANQTDYGLTAQIYTQDLKLGQKIVSQLEAGIVSLNSDSYSTTETPFGGYKKSGLGREGGKYGLHELTQIKYICERKI